MSVSYLGNFALSPSHIEVGFGGAIHLIHDQILFEKSFLPTSKLYVSTYVSTYVPPSLIGIIGYRLQPASSGLIFRIVVNPVIQLWDKNFQPPNDSMFKIWGGISFGYTF